jgi:hypothetical protein
MDTLYRHGYDLSSAISVLVPLGGPVLCRDEMEEWSASEACLFEEALEKYGKDFNDIRQDFVSGKLRRTPWDGNIALFSLFSNSSTFNMPLAQGLLVSGIKARASSTSSATDPHPQPRQ